MDFTELSVNGATLTRLLKERRPSRQGVCHPAGVARLATWRIESSRTCAQARWAASRVTRRFPLFR